MTKSDIEKIREARCRVKQITKWHSHYYKYESDTVSYPSVTTITRIVNSGNLIAWHDKLAIEHLKKCIYGDCDVDDVYLPDKAGDLLNVFENALEESDRVRDAAAEFGTQVHKLIEEWAMRAHSKDFQHDSDVKEHAKRAIDFYQSLDISPLKAEMLVFHQPSVILPGFGGMIDFVGCDILTGRTYVIDWKTSNSTHDSHKWQVAAYCMALKQYCKLEHIPIGYVYYTKHDKSVKVDTLNDWLTFTHIARVWDDTHKTRIYV